METYRYICFSINTFENFRKILDGSNNNSYTLFLKKLTNFSNGLKEISNFQVKARKLNLLGLVVTLSTMIITVSYTFLTKPWLFHYYNAFIQLYQKNNAKMAIHHLEKIINNYPFIKYIDTIYYYKAWVLDRKLKDITKAEEEYNLFLKKFSTNNLWTPEVLYSLSLLYLATSNYKSLLYYTTKYNNLFTNGYYAPIMTIYKIVALHKTNKDFMFRYYLRQAMNLYKKRFIVIYDKDDNFENYIPFETLIKLIFFSQNINILLE